MNKVSLLASALLVSSAAFAAPSFADQVTTDTYSSLQDSNRSIESVTPFANVEYVVTVNTAKLKDAGTDSNISITLYGSNGDYATATLNGSFEQGDSDTTRISTSNLGDIRKITIRTDGSGHKPGWKIANIKITGNRKTLPFASPNRWLGDGGSPDFETLFPS
ncbi:PLAT/LH2 domain-containing protein [Paenibacillus sp. Mc5Re-14]|uniref:PLAT/LH2 domain-containing protein n=1 Tax=Paenibacillus sp. Mc5Re-14 TaxID=1030529 RepID=UPI000A6B7E7E|nr:PLAT/LH2 domain-containing protein [Paenibacillus sp. Mc5Re-14]